MTAKGNTTENQHSQAADEREWLYGGIAWVGIGLMGMVSVPTLGAGMYQDPFMETFAMGTCALGVAYGLISVFLGVCSIRDRRRKQKEMVNAS